MRCCASGLRKCSAIWRSDAPTPPGSALHSPYHAFFESSPSHHFYLLYLIHMIIAIYGSRRQDDNAQQIFSFLDTLAYKGVEIIMHCRLFDSLQSLLPGLAKMVTRVADTPDFHADIVVSFGGDGTFLRTAMWVADKEIPILGVNTGHLGYLTTACVSDLPDVAREILSGDYGIERRSLLHVSEPELYTWPYALNEVVVNKYDTASVINAETCINGKQLADYRADGLIVATPTGSTAYNLSVGGPVLQPTAPVLAVSPIAAHTLTMRPLVVSDDSHIEIKVESRASGFRITLDGRTGTLPVGSVIKVRKAPFRVLLICRKGYEFPETLRNKLSWGV